MFQTSIPPHPIHILPHYPRYTCKPIKPKVLIISNWRCCSQRMWHYHTIHPCTTGGTLILKCRLSHPFYTILPITQLLCSWAIGCKTTPGKSIHVARVGYSTLHPDSIQHPLEVWPGMARYGVSNTGCILPSCAASTEARQGRFHWKSLIWTVVLTRSWQIQHLAIDTFLVLQLGEEETGVTFRICKVA